MLKMARNIQLNWLLLTVIVICVGNVVCKPAIKNIKRNIQKVNSASGEVLGDSSANSDVNEEIDTVKTSGNVTVNEESSVRRPGSTVPEDENIDSGNYSAGGVFFDAADWVKEAEQWTFKGGDWGLVTLPNDGHPDIPTPPVPGPVLIAEGDTLRKVIVSRSEENLENLTLHFSYFLSNNPKNPPLLEVYQIQDDTHSERVSVEATYGEWTTSTIALPYSGKFEIKFIGQRIVDSNEIALDDIVLRGYYMNEDMESQDTSFEEDEVYDVSDTDTQNTTQIVEEGHSKADNDTQTAKELDKDVNADLQTVEEGGLGVVNDTQNAGEVDLEVDSNTQVSDEGDLMANSNTQVTNNDDQAKGNKTEIEAEDNEDKDKVTQGTAEYEDNDDKDKVTKGTAEDDQEIKATTPDNEDFWIDIYDDVYTDDGYDNTNDKENGWFFNNWLNNNDDNSNSTEDSNNPLDSIDGHEISEISIEIEDAGVGGAMIMFWTVSVVGFILLGFLYWRRRRWGNDERTIFNRATAGQNDFDRLMYTDVPYEDDNTNGKNYRSFD